MRLEQADQLAISTIVDNLTDSLSSVPAGVTHEFAHLMRRGLARLSGSCLCCAQFGLSLAITATIDAQQSTVLFDAGPDGSLWLRNAQCLGTDLAEIDSIVLSHGHWDHGGGLLLATRAIVESRPERPPAVHINPGMFVERGLELPNGSVLPFALLPEPEEFAAAGATLRLDECERLINPGLFYLSGAIPRVTPFERGLPGHVARERPDAPWQPDPLIMDERFLAAHVKGRGIAVFTACSHAGLINVLTAAQATFPDQPLLAVVGGFHLSGANEPLIEQTVQALRRFDLQRIVPGHCTGYRAVGALLSEFGDEIVVPLAVGRQFVF